MVPVVISAITSQHAAAGSTVTTGGSTGFTSAPAVRTDGIGEPGGCRGDE
ncbi:hypothetical protein [Streptomyces lydicus]